MKISQSKIQTVDVIIEASFSEPHLVMTIVCCLYILVSVGMCHYNIQMFQACVNPRICVNNIESILILIFIPSSCYICHKRLAASWLLKCATSAVCEQISNTEI